MARETFEDQAASVRRALSGGTLSKEDRKHLERAARNLDAFGAFRQKVVTVTKTHVSEEQVEGIADEIIQLLHIPIPGS